MPDTLSAKAQLSAYSRFVLVQVKIERAKKHLVDLERELSSTAGRTYRYVALAHKDPETGKQEVHGHAAYRVLPFDVVATAGDVIQNLRSALDHLANQLVLVNGQEPTRITCFPISENFATYEGDKVRRVKGMRPEAVEAIDRLKPYSGGNDLLWKLHELNNIDKHRLLFTIERDTLFVADWLDNPFLMKHSYPHFTGVSDGEVENNIDLEISEAVGQSEVVKGNALLPTLHQLVNAVEDLVFSFKPLLE